MSAQLELFFWLKMKIMKKGLYVCQYDQGTIKIGMGVDVYSRIRSHKSAGLVFGINLLQYEIIECQDAKIAESRLIKWCSENSSSKQSREWFNGVDYQRCVEAAKLAVASTIGPTKVASKNTKDAFSAMMNYYKSKPTTKESDLYFQVQKMMHSNKTDSTLVKLLDFIHAESEMVRIGICNGEKPPEWFALLNCFEFWELELWFSKGVPSSDLILSASEAMKSIMESE